MEKRTHKRCTRRERKHKKHEIQKENLHINYQPFIFYLLLATCHLALPTLAHVWVCVKFTFYICCKPLQSNRFQTDWEWAKPNQAKQPASERIGFYRISKHIETLGWNALSVPLKITLNQLESRGAPTQYATYTYGMVWYRCHWSNIQFHWLGIKVDVMFIMSMCIGVKSALTFCDLVLKLLVYKSVDKNIYIVDVYVYAT